MNKLSNYTGETVFVIEVMGYRDDKNPYDCRIEKGGRVMKTSEAIKYIAFRKCVNMICPDVYTDSSMLEKLDIQDVERNLGDE